MKTGLFFGSFNPIHNGHLIIANHVLNETDLQRIWFVLSPQNPFKESSRLLNEYDRLHLARLAVEDDERLKVTDIEFSLPRPSYTSHTLAYLQEKYPDYEFSIIMGSDSFQNLPKWKNADFILTHYRILVYKRQGFEMTTTYGGNAVLLDAPLLQISATYIRELIVSGKSIRYLVPAAVEEEILSGNYYRNIRKKSP